jgi:ankyrin repeat protein
VFLVVAPKRRLTIMKTFTSLLLAIATANPIWAGPGALAGALQKGLIEEEVNRDVQAAIQAYESAVAQFDKDRQLAATAIFRLAENYRRTGRTNEAAKLYQRIAREFPDQEQLVAASQRHLPGQPGVELPHPLIQGQEELEEIRKLQELMKNSPDLLRAPGEAGSTRLHQAAANGHLKAASFLLDHGIEADVRKASGHTPLYDAALNGRKAMAELLISRGADPNATTRAGSSPLHIAASQGHRAVAEVLLKNSSEIDARTRDGSTPLLLAVSKNQVHVTRLLIEQGANLEIPGGQGLERRTPLHAAVLQANVQTVRLLLAHGADIESRNSTGDPPLHAAVWPVERPGVRFTHPRDPMSAEKIFVLLLESGADVDSRGSKEGTALHRAIRLHNERAAELLLAHGADINVQDATGATPLMARAGEYSLEMARAGEYSQDLAKFLLNKGAETDLQNNAGETVLHLAAAALNVEFLELLLKHGADPNIPDHQNRTPLDYLTPARREGAELIRMIELLEEYGGRSGFHTVTGTAFGARLHGPRWKVSTVMTATKILEQLQSPPPSRAIGEPAPSRPLEHSVEFKIYRVSSDGTDQEIIVDVPAIRRGESEDVIIEDGDRLEIRAIPPDTHRQLENR